MSNIRITILNKLGQSIRLKGDWWEYETIKDGTLLVEVFDPAGSHTWQEVSPKEK